MREILPDMDIRGLPEDTQKELWSEAEEYADLIKKAYGDYFARGGKPTMVQYISTEDSAYGEGYLFLDKDKCYFESPTPENTWVIETSTRGIFTALKRAYFCERKEAFGGWNVAVKHLRKWMRKLEREQARKECDK